MIQGIGLPGATELVVILVLGLLVGGIVITTLLITRSKRRASGADGERAPEADVSSRR